MVIWTKMGILNDSVFLLLFFESYQLVPFLSNYFLF